MNRFIAVLSVFLSVSLTASAQFRSDYSELDDSETVAAFRAHVGYLASAALEGRAAGSEGEADAAEYVREVRSSQVQRAIHSASSGKAVIRSCQGTSWASSPAMTRNCATGT